MHTSITSEVQTETDGESHHRADLLQAIKRHCEATRKVRRGVCLLNAGKYEEALEAFRDAERSGSVDKSLPRYLAACLMGSRQPGAAAAYLEESAEEDSDAETGRIRHALALWEAGRRSEAVASLRDAVRENPECAELHFQLGTLLTSLDQHEEAELRFTQAITIDGDHTDALMSLAMCCGIRGAATEAVVHLQRAQARRPRDARIGLYLAQAAKAARENGHAVRVRATMFDHKPPADEEGIVELSRVIEEEPDFVDAFLSIPTGEVDEQVFAMLLATLQAALERQPEHAELHYHCGRVLRRLGRHDDAIDENVRAVEIDPRFTLALIELGKLYKSTQREHDATVRLEQAVRAGAQYADVFFLLGNLYRSSGQMGRARSAYRRAISINHGYKDAMLALASLPV